MKKKLTLVQALKEFKLEYSVLEEVSGIPKGTIAQYTHGNQKSYGTAVKANTEVL